VLWFSLLSTARPRAGGGEACVRTRCWGLITAHVGQARDFVFVEVAPCPCLWPAAVVCGASLWYAVASLSCHPCSFAVPLAVMSANLATSPCTTGLACSQNPPIAAELMPPMRWIWVCMGGGGTTPAGDTSASMAAAAASLSFTDSAARRSVHAAPPKGRR
jgi:hypothetical protein